MDLIFSSWSACRRHFYAIPNEIAVKKCHAFNSGRTQRPKVSVIELSENLKTFLSCMFEEPGSNCGQRVWFLEGIEVQNIILQGYNQQVQIVTKFRTFVGLDLGLWTPILCENPIRGSENERTWTNHSVSKQNDSTIFTEIRMPRCFGSCSAQRVSPFNAWPTFDSWRCFSWNGCSGEWGQLGAKRKAADRELQECRGINKIRDEMTFLRHPKLCRSQDKIRKCIVPFTSPQTLNNRGDVARLLIGR